MVVATVREAMDKSAEWRLRWPQSTVPTFKILACECLHKVWIGEQISLVRMKVSWPLSMREAIVYYYLFEYFQDDLIVILTNSVPESNGVNLIINGLNEVIPEAKDVVRVDLVGGFALQKTVASMMSHGEEELSKALGDPLYVRIRESLSLNKMRIFSLLKRTLLKVSKMRQRLQLKRIKAINMQIVPRRWW
ncbi:hypothetical protein AHAS_Ahas20G0146800 [Arachis hypogaea]